MQNWIVWNGTVFMPDWIVWIKTFDETEYLEKEMILTIKLCPNTKLNCLK